MRVDVVTAKQAVEMISDNSAVILGGFIGAVVPEEIEEALGQRFMETGSPRDLTYVFAAGQGDSKEKAVNHLAHEGMVKAAIGGHWGLIPKLQKLAVDNKIQGYNLPQGVITQLLRDTAAGKPGTISHVGLGTFVDPRVEGGKINESTKEDWVRLLPIDGEEYLFYKRLPADFAILRGTTSDENGNITMEDECLVLENLAAAQAVKNQGGKVIVQVKKMVKNGVLDPHSVKIPGILVDAVVVASEAEYHMQTFGVAHDDSFVGRGLKEVGKDPEFHRLDAKKIVARRAAFELKEQAILNLGIGVPEGVADVADEEGVTDKMILTVEPGAIGGTPAGSLSFGASSYPEAIITQDQQFDFYDGGGLDQAFLGLAQCDVKGDLNVSRFGSKIAGCGGFINITQNAKEVFFCGTFTAGKQKIEVADGKLNIVQDGSISKFINKVQQITFSADLARKNHKPVLYITERAVFRMVEQGLELIEIAPGVDLERDVLHKMDFVPQISPNLKLMDSRIFHDELMGLSLKAPLTRVA